MKPTPCPDAARARWLVHADLPREQLATLGPPGLPAHARVRFLQDPEFEWRREKEVHSEPGRLPEVDAPAWTLLPQDRPWPGHKSGRRPRARRPDQSRWEPLNYFRPRHMRIGFGTEPSWIVVC
jgi:hypothetical protein